MKNMVLGMLLILGLTSCKPTQLDADLIFLKAQLAKSELLLKQRAFAYKVREELSPYKAGEDYAPIIQALHDTLPPAGGIIEIPHGRYWIRTGINITKPNVTIRAKTLGDVVIEEHLPYDYKTDHKNTLYTQIFYAPKGAHALKLENLVFFGSREKVRVFALITESTKNVKVQNNIFIGFDGAVRMLFTTAGLLKGNFFFDNGYSSAGIFGKRDETLAPVNRCPILATGNIAEDNFFDGNYQNLIYYCNTAGLIRNNVFRGSKESGLRIESSWANKIENNLIHKNEGAGLWLYAYSSDNEVTANVIIDNNTDDRPYVDDCYDPHQTVQHECLENRMGPLEYARERKDQFGVKVCMNYACQFGGADIELRNTIHRSKIRDNYFGQFETLGAPASVTPIIRFSFYTQFYGGKNHAGRVDRGNALTDNKFLGANEPVRGHACDTTFSGNKKLNFEKGTIDALELKMENHAQCVLPFDAPQCNNNGQCESYFSENMIRCPNDCPRLEAGAIGSQMKHERCKPGLLVTDNDVFPSASPRKWDGSFKCILPPTPVTQLREHINLQSRF